MTAPSVPVERLVWRDGTRSVGERSLAEETAIAITYNRITHAVTMATPDDLFDFAVGFSLSEGIVPAYGEIEDFWVIEAEGGIELRMWIPAHHMAALEKRRRRLAGATGCGMCGLESLGEALRPVPNVPRGKIFDADAINRAAVSLADGQTLNHLTRAVHGAGFWTPGQGLVAVREDVGRHNALDKLGGALARAEIPASDGILLLTSRISIELVQKAARMGVPIVVAISAPTALAVCAADAAGITLVGVARRDGFEMLRIETESSCKRSRWSDPNAWFASRTTPHKSMHMLRCP
jgi:FdhD protein